MEHHKGLLLDTLFQISGRSSLSDFRYEMTMAEVVKIIQRINPSDYSLSQWSYMLSYISDRKIEVQSTAELSEILQSMNEQKHS